MVLNSQSYYRLIALWVLCEAMLGGVIHALRIPVSGLIVGSAAVVCICLIAFYNPVKGSIIKATVIVAIFKMMLSPQAPILAYAAVFFQGMMGELIFWNKRFYRAGCLLLGVLALLESGLQRILVLTVVYGNDLWKVINDFIIELTKQKTFTNYSLYIAGSYVLLHVLVGFIVGWWAGVIPGRVVKWKRQYKDVFQSAENEKTGVAVSRKKRRFKKGLFIIWIILLLLWLQSYFRIGDPLLPSHLAFRILVRSVIIILAWVLVIGPLFSFLLKKWLQKKQSASQKDIGEVLELLPSMRVIVSKSWRSSSSKKGLKRIILCSKLVLVKSLPLVEKEIIVLTGTIRAGKTTSLLKWSENKKDVCGILTPVINGKRFFMDISAKEMFPMEAGEDEKETISVGKFLFSKKAFEKAADIISDSMNKKGWLVIDEIGPLELKQEGFYSILKEVLKKHPHQLILIVREGLADKVAEVFELGEFTIIKKEDVGQL